MNKVDEKLTEILNNQRVELSTGAIIVVVITTLVTNIWSQWLFQKLGISDRMNLIRLLIITVIGISAVWWIMKKRKESQFEN